MGNTEEEGERRHREYKKCLRKPQRKPYFMFTLKSMTCTQLGRFSDDAPRQSHGVVKRKPDTKFGNLHSGSWSGESKRLPQTI